VTEQPWSLLIRSEAAMEFPPPHLGSLERFRKQLRASVFLAMLVVDLECQLLCECFIH
jgi:hypothetical protein